MTSTAAGTNSLLAHLGGDPKGVENLLPLVYDRLRRLAASYMSRERSDHTLQPTALVHEAYARLIDASQIDLQGRNHFFALAAREMRRVLREHARKHNADKRGGGLKKITLNEDIAPDPEARTNFLDLDEALKKLARLNERRGRIVELRVFAGMAAHEIGEVLGVSERTVRDDWRVAKAWLRRELQHGSP